jgi:hypothetical protein
MLFTGQTTLQGLVKVTPQFLSTRPMRSIQV